MIKLKTSFPSFKKIMGSYGKLINKGTMRAINRTAPQTRSEFNRQIKKIYNYPLARLVDKKKKNVKTTKASLTRLEAHILVSGKPQSLIEFTKATGEKNWLVARYLAQVGRKGGVTRLAGGVKVRVMKKERLHVIKHTFIAPGTKSGKPLVYWREKGLSSPKTGKHRLTARSGLVGRYPIKALYGPSIPQMFNNPIVIKNANRYYLQQFKKNFDKEMKYLMEQQDKKMKKL